MEALLTFAQSVSPIGVIAILAIIIFRLVVDKLSIGSILGLNKKISEVQEKKYPELEDHYKEMKMLTAQNKKLLENHFQHEIPDMVRDLGEIKSMVGEQGQRLTRVETLVEVLREKK